MMTSYSPIFMRAVSYVDTKTRKHVINPRGFILSEKFDGQRAQWNPVTKQLISRNGNVVSAPEWYLKYLNDIELPLDGELFMGYGKWNLTGIFRSSKDNELWRRAKFMIFDVADESGVMGTFQERRSKLELFFKEQGWDSDPQCPIKLVKVSYVQSHSDVEKEYQKIIKRGGEGIILNNPYSLYHNGKSQSLFKYKPVMDDEAVIVGYKMGNGRLTGKLGSFTMHPIEDGQPQPKREFGLSGVNNVIRANYKLSHPIGTVVRYRCSELTSSGKPRHPTYLGKCDKVITNIDMIKEPGQLKPCILQLPKDLKIKSLEIEKPRIHIKVKLRK